MNEFYINPENLKQELSEMPMHMGDIARRVAEARNTEGVAEKTYRLTKYVVEKELREMYRPGGVLGHKPTEDSIKMEVALDPRVKRAHVELSNAESNLRLLEAELMAYTCKKEMLVSLTAYLRSELDTIKFSNVR